MKFMSEYADSNALLSLGFRFRASTFQVGRTPHGRFSKQGALGTPGIPVSYEIQSTRVPIHLGSSLLCV